MRKVGHLKVEIFSFCSLTLGAVKTQLVTSTCTSAMLYML